MEEETSKPGNEAEDGETAGNGRPASGGQAHQTQVFIPKKKEAPGEVKPGRWEKLKRFGVECKRVLTVTRKPDKIEFKTIVKISGIGIIIIGLIGFLIHFIKELLF